MVYTSTKKSANLNKYLPSIQIKKEKLIVGVDRKGLCSALTTKGKHCSRKKSSDSEFCKLHRAKKRKLEIYVKWLKENNPNISSKIPDFLIPFSEKNMPPNQTKLIYSQIGEYTQDI